jgi:MAP kinase interacting serine/threonine kinase
MFYFDEDHEDNGFDVATPLSDSYRLSALTPAIPSTATSSPAGLIHNTYCTTPTQNQNYLNSLTSPSTKQPSLFGSTTTATGIVGGDADWRKEELQITSTKTSKATTFCGKTIEKDNHIEERRSFYLGGDDEDSGEEKEEDGQHHQEGEEEDSDFEDEIESLIDNSSDEEEDHHHHRQEVFPLDDDSGFGTISTEPSLEDEMCDRPSELISLPRSIRIGSVGRRGIMRTPRGRKQRLQFTDFYELTDDHLGQGAYASVRTAIQKSTRKEFAVKLVNKHVAGHTRSKIMREVEIFKICKGHPNIVQLIQWFEDDNNYYMVFEKMRGGPLLNHIQAKSCFTEEEASQVTKDIAMALKFLHDRGIAHRDIKPENILCTESDRVSPVKICDFDLASKPPNLSARFPRHRFGADCHGSENSVSRSLPVVHSEPDLASPVGSAEFMAPEVVEAFTGDRFKYDKRCDMWALGVVLYVMLCGYPPFYGQCDNEDCNWAQGEACDDCQQNLFERIQTGEYDFPDEEWEEISDDAKDLICHLLVKDVRQRYTAADVLRHSWVVHEAPQTPLSTVTNLIYRNDSARDITMMNENFNAINRMKAERLANGQLTIDEVDTSSSGSPPSPTTLFPNEEIKNPLIPQYVPVHTPAAIIQAQSPYNNNNTNHHNGFYPAVTQPQLINMNGMMIYAPQMAAPHTPEYNMTYAGTRPQQQQHASEIRNGTTYFYPNHHQQQQSQHPPTSHPWYSPQMQHHAFHQHQQHQLQHPQQHNNNAGNNIISRSLDQQSAVAAASLNGAFSQMGLETCQNAMQRQDSKNEIQQTRETQVNV